MAIPAGHHIHPTTAYINLTLIKNRHYILTHYDLVKES